ncbi:hypothetical protein ACFLSQ_08180 [Bacteroidota bacterium]
MQSVVTTDRTGKKEVGIFRTEVRQGVHELCKLREPEQLFN